MRRGIDPNPTHATWVWHFQNGNRLRTSLEKSWMATTPSSGPLAHQPAMMDAPWSYAPPYDIDHAQFLRDGFVILREA